MPYLLLDATPDAKPVSTFAGVAPCSLRSGSRNHRHLPRPSEIRVRLLHIAFGTVNVELGTAHATTAKAEIRSGPPQPDHRGRGVAGATHRRIAEAANVPLGSMSYHFNGLDEVFVAAVSQLAETVSAKFVELLDDG